MKADEWASALENRRLAAAAEKQQVAEAGERPLRRRLRHQHRRLPREGPQRRQEPVFRLQADALRRDRTNAERLRRELRGRRHRSLKRFRRLRKIFPTFRWFAPYIVESRVEFGSDSMRPNEAKRTKPSQRQSEPKYKEYVVTCKHFEIFDKIKLLKKVLRT